MRGKLIIISFLVVFTIIAIVAIWTQIIPIYQAQVEVRVQPIIPHLVFQSEDRGVIPLYVSFVNTQVSIITNMIVLQLVLDQQ